MLRIRILGASLGASLVALVTGAGLAAAADIPDYVPPPAAAYSPAPAYSWTGPYLGLQGGYGWGGGTVGNSGWIGGAYMGYNFQTSTNWVVGIEGDVSATGKSGTASGQTITNPWDATVRGRVGYAVDRFLIYGTGGVAFGGVTSNDGGAAESATKIGWTAGAGVEALLTQNVTGRLEFRHTNLGTVNFASDPSVNYTSNDILVGVGVKF
ncbi:MAG: outer membrane beta-barrel protein [Bauldia sp.]|nr:outer membrane beta-barrel protein [Bauldia sp.]